MEEREHEQMIEVLMQVLKRFARLEKHIQELQEDVRGLKEQMQTMEYSLQETTMDWTQAMEMLDNQVTTLEELVERLQEEKEDCSGFPGFPPSWLS